MEQQLSYPEVLERFGRTYKDSYLGFSVRHPLDWGIESSDRTVIQFNDPQSNGEGLEIAVYNSGDEEVLRKTYNIDSEHNVMVDKVKGRELVLEGDRDHQEKVVLVNKDQHLFVIRGDTPYFEHILKTFNFIPPVK